MAVRCPHCSQILTTEEASTGECSLCKGIIAERTTEAAAVGSSGGNRVGGGEEDNETAVQDYAPKKRPGARDDDDSDADPAPRVGVSFFKLME